MKSNIKKHISELSVFEVSRESLMDRKEATKRVVFNMTTFCVPVEYLEAIARATYW
jgi:hypothetical protein